jgi:hypothetical protein
MCIQNLFSLQVIVIKLEGTATRKETEGIYNIAYVHALTPFSRVPIQQRIISRLA